MTARKAKAPAVALVSENNDLPPVTEETFTPEDYAIEGLMRELAGDTGASVRIYREGPGGYRDLTFIDEVGLSEFNPKMLKGPPYNGGTFRVHIRDAEGLRGNRQLKVEPAPKQPDAPAQPQGAPALTIEQIAAAVRAALPQAPTGPSRKEMLEEMAMMAAMFKQDRPAPAPADPMASLTQALSLIQSVKGMMPEPAVDTGDTTANLLLEGVRTVSAAFANAKGAAPMMPAQGNPITIAPPIPPATNAIGQVQIVPVTNEGATATTQQGDSEMSLMQKMMVGIAIGDAKKGADVSSDAAIFYEKADDDLLNIVIDGEDATGKDWFTVLCEINSDAKDYRPWFEAFRAKVLEYDKANQAEHGEPDAAPASQTGLTTTP